MDAAQQKDFIKKVKIATAVVTATVVVILLLVYTVKVFFLVLASVLMAIFFRAIAGFISKKTGMAMKFSLPISVIAVFAVWTGLFFLLQPKVSEQMKLMGEQLPQAVQKVQQQMQQSQAGRFVIAQIPFDLQTLETTGEEKSGNPEGGPATPKAGGENQVAKFLKSFFSTTLGVLGDVYVIFLLGMFFTANPAPYKKGMVALFPKHRRKRMGEVIEGSGITLRLWLFGKLMSMLVVAVLSLIGLWILGVPLFVTLALLAGLLSFIPNFGPLMAIVPAFLVGYVESPALGFYVILLYIGIQAVESNLITPVIMKSQIQIPLAMTLFSQVLLALLVGGLGLIFATPIVAVIMVIIQMLYVEDILGDKSIEVPGEQLAREKA